MERALLDWLKTATQKKPHPNVVLGVGDDAAIVDFQSGSTVISSDMLADGVHFMVGQTPLESIGRKAMAVNLSDIAAMAAKPVCAVVSLMLPKSFSLDDAKTLFGGMLELANQFGVAIVGGDTNRWDGPLVINVTITGLVDEASPAAGGWAMDGARAGDTILVSGDFGHSIKQKHLQFTPRIALAMFLRGQYSIHAATDVTDSLSVDLSLIAQQSGLGFQLDAVAIPISSDALAEYSDDDDAALSAALHDGEDFELAITVDSETAKRILEDPKLPCPMTAIGTMTEAKTFFLKDKDGQIHSLEIKGYEH